MTEIRSAVWLDVAHTAAKCVIFADALGADVPYTVRQADTGRDDFAREVWQALASFPVQDPEPDPVAQREARARIRRDTYLSRTDVYMLPDYPITPEDRAVVAAYREYLRHLPDTAGWYDRPILTLDEWRQQHGAE